jgi:cytochrome aa3-600 menaquinol oxidase subunit II
MLKNKNRLIAGLASFYFPLIFATGCGTRYSVLNPQGPVAWSEYKLIIWSLVVMSIAVLVVLGLYTFIVVRYREKPENMDYEPPETKSSKTLEIIWTAAPIVMVMALAIPMARTTFSLENPPPHPANTAPMTIYVTSADWKWIFKYPGQNIETVNYVHIPANTPIKFELTSATSMNSFWVPTLGGQEYNMPGQRLRLWLQADKPGTYGGRGANFTGRGFAHMVFDVVAQTPADFASWVQTVKNTAPKLTDAGYQKLLTQGLAPKMTFSSMDHRPLEQEALLSPAPGDQGQSSSSSKQNMPYMPNMSNMPKMQDTTHHP